MDERLDVSSKLGELTRSNFGDVFSVGEDHAT